MNSIRFYVDMNDNVLKCEYFESIDKFVHEIIKLSPIELHDMLFRFLKKYSFPISDVLNNEVSVITFFDVDVFEMDNIIERSNRYKKDVLKKAQNYSTENNANEENTKKKVSRKNKFKKIVVGTSATILATLLLYAAGKEISKDFDKNVGNSTNDITYDEPLILHFNSHDNTFPVDDIEVMKDADSTDFKSTDTILKVNKENESDEIEYDAEIDTSVEDTSVYVQNDNITDVDNEIIPDIIFSLDTEDWTDTEKYTIAHAYYSETIAKTARTYGIDPQLALAIGVHERGLHSEYVDAGGGMGLFQIQVEGSWNWVGKQIMAYNFDTNSYESITITKETASDVFENIKIGCMMIQDILVRNNYNVLKAVTEYNYGTENLRIVLQRCSNETGFRTDELNDMNNLEWLKYRNIIANGDPEYLENVFKYIPNGSILSFTKPNGEEITMMYNNSNVLSHGV